MLSVTFTCQSSHLAWCTSHLLIYFINCFIRAVPNGLLGTRLGIHQVDPEQRQCEQADSRGFPVSRPVHSFQTSCHTVFYISVSPKALTKKAFLWELMLEDTTNIYVRVCADVLTWKWIQQDNLQKRDYCFRAWWGLQGEECSLSSCQSFVCIFSSINLNLIVAPLSRAFYQESVTYSN